MSTAEYKKENYDQVLIRVKKGLRDEYQRAAAAGLKLGYAEMIRLAIEEFIANHSGADLSVRATPADNTAEKNSVDDSNQQPKITTQDRQLLDAINALSPESRKALLKFLQSLNTEILFLYNGSD